MTASFLTLLGIPQAPLTPRTALEEPGLQRNTRICVCFTCLSTSIGIKNILFLCASLGPLVVRTH